MKTIYRSLILLFFFAPLALMQAKPLYIGIIGDSTVSDYDPNKTILRGWGQLLPEFLSKETKVLNLARSGRSTSTFPKDLWETILKEKPDYVLIQFGHNDSHAKGRPESTDAGTDFRENLKRYIEEARAAGIQPILVTPMHRRTFNPQTGELKDILLPYAEGMKVVAKETDTPLLDLHEESGLLFKQLGEEDSTFITANELERKGKPGSDRTHFTEKGARVMAALVAKMLGEVNPELHDIVELKKFH